MKDFLQRLAEERPLLLDGGCGALLLARGGAAASGDNNIEHPQLVAALHSDYLSAGAECVTSNTFSLNGIYSQRQGKSAEQSEHLLRAGMEIAASAAQQGAYLLADIGPAGEMLQPFGPGDPAAFSAAFARQAELMAEYIPAAFLVETLFDINEAELIVAACQEAAPQIPVLLSMTFVDTKRGGTTMMGDRASAIAEQAEEWGCAAVGGNCGQLSPLEYAEVMATMKQNCGLPLLVQPNAGQPVVEQGQVRYLLQPDDFARQIRACYEAGARLLGGCCGTTPAHIEAVAKLFS